MVIETSKDRQSTCLTASTDIDANQGRLHTVQVLPPIREIWFSEPDGSS